MPRQKQRNKFKKATIAATILTIANKTFRSFLFNALIFILGFGIAATFIIKHLQKHQKQEITIVVESQQQRCIEDIETCIQKQDEVQTKLKKDLERLRSTQSK